MADNDDDDEDFTKEIRSRKTRNSRDGDWLTESKAKKIITEEFNEKFQTFFQGIGYDIKEYKDIRTLREDLSFLRGLRESSQERKSTFLKSIITSLIGTVMGLLVSLIIWLFSNGAPKHLP